MRSGTIILVIGTRPEAIKLAPVAHALVRRGLSVELLFTGQHARLDPKAFGLGAIPHRRFACQGSGDPFRHADRVASALAPTLGSGRAALVVVQGDTSSALGGARAAVAAGVPLAHVEAGLRSFDSAMPWPEEDNRVAIDRHAALLFAPTAVSAGNLHREGVSGAVHVTGNTGIDALRAVLGTLPAPPLRAVGAPRRVLVTCHRRENWGAAFTPIALALLQLAKLPGLHIDVVLHPNPAMSAVMRTVLANQPRLRLLAPMDHRAMLAAMRGAALILSDSGGIQEEAPALGVPLLVLRDKTERPEAIASGNMALVGTQTLAIVEAVQGLLEDAGRYARMARPALPFGNGFAAERIADLVLAHLSSQAAKEPELLTA
jgi:UDP-N-acetylglucosamine 2-epimerase (non-hydrolysing)